MKYNFEAKLAYYKDEILFSDDDSKDYSLIGKLYSLWTSDKCIKESFQLDGKEIDIKVVKIEVFCED